MEVYKRGKLIGPGGVNLKKLLVQTGVQVQLEKISFIFICSGISSPFVIINNNLQVTPHEDGTFTIFAPNQEAMNEAKEYIEKILSESREPQLEFGGIYKAKIVEIRETGVMVTLYDSMVPTLLHNSQLDQRKVR